MMGASRGAIQTAQSLLQGLPQTWTRGNEPPRLLVYVSIRAEHAGVTGSVDRARGDVINQAARLAGKTGDIRSARALWFWAQRLGIEGLPELSAAPHRQLIAAGACRWRRPRRSVLRVEVAPEKIPAGVRKKTDGQP